MNIGIVGGGINGLCCAWRLAEQGHQVTLYERNTIMSATSRCSSKLLHGGLRYLENAEFRLVREALRERDAWLKMAPQFTKPIRITMPIYKHSRRSKLLISAGLFLYDHLAGKSVLPKSKWLNVDQTLRNNPQLNSEELLGGFEFSDGQMDDYALGHWVADQAKSCGAVIKENTEVKSISNSGIVDFGHTAIRHEKLINIAGPWAVDLLERSGLTSPYQLDLVRGSHLILNQPTEQAYLLEVPNERRIFFVLPWKGKTMVGTTEVRQSINDNIECTTEEKQYLLDAYKYYFPFCSAKITETFAGVRPLLFSAKDPNKATREYVIHRDEKLTTVLGGKWTTSMALAKKLTETIH